MTDLRAFASNTNRPSPADTLTHGYRLAASVALTMLLMAGLAIPVLAQVDASRSVPTDADVGTSLEPISSDLWHTHFDEQAARLLRQESAGSIRTTILQDVIVVAQRSDDIDLSMTANALLHVLETDPNSQHRLMAIQALHAIGTEHADEDLYRTTMERLYALMLNESSEHVRQVASARLNAYFATNETG